MIKRTVVTFLWFMATLCTWELVAYFTGWPRLIGPVLATMAAATVGIDPFGVLWTEPGADPAAQAGPTAAPATTVHVPGH